MINETLSTSCFNKIIQLIYNGDLPPGEHIKGEYLKNQLGTGLTPIREALSRMINTNIVEFIDNIGFKVSKITTKIVTDTYISYAKLETMLLKEAIENGDDIWESNIVASLYRLSKIESEGTNAAYEIWSKQNEEFHDSLISGCNLSGLKNTRLNLLLLKNWYTNLANKNSMHQQIDVNHSEHSKIAELTISRRSEAACSLLYKHLMHSLPPLILKLKQQEFLST